MAEKILYRHQIQESEGFDSIGTPVPVPGPRTGQPAMQVAQVDPTGKSTATVTTDIAQQGAYVPLVQNAVSVSLPYMLSYVQPLQSSTGFVFGLQQKDKTKIPAQPAGDDVAVIRKYVETEVREVTLDLTNETAEDIVNLFGDSFNLSYDKFIKSGGEVWDGPNGPLAKFFLSLAKQRMTSKINRDFVTWIDSQAFPAGAATFNNSLGLKDIIIAFGEMRETLFNRSNKDAQLWLLTTPKIANFVATYFERLEGSDDVNGEWHKPKSQEHGYVATIGDIEVYQSEFVKPGKTYMGYRGSPGSSSLFYYPYSEYIIQAGEDYHTGQSNVYYRVRDTWSTNPLDTYGNTITEPALGTATQAIPANESNFIVSADINVNFKILN